MAKEQGFWQIEETTVLISEKGIEIKMIRGLELRIRTRQLFLKERLDGFESWCLAWREVKG
jgi:hypothetical protein